VNRKPNRFTLIGQSPLDRLFDPPANAVAEYIVATEMPQNSSERARLPKAFDGHIGDALPIAIYPRLFEYGPWGAMEQWMQLRFIVRRIGITRRRF